MGLRRNAFVAAVIAATTFGGVRPAWANGRFPASNGVLFAPADDATVVVRVTFGLLVTKDRGRSWGWVCERAIGFSGPEDPTYVITKSGAIVAGLFDGLRVSRDGGCSWEAVKTDASVFVDVTMRSDGAILALASSYDRHGDGGSLYRTQLWISTDDARSFVALAPRFDPTLLGETVEVAPSDPQRIYISAVRGDDVGRQGVLLASIDGGEHWVERTAALEAKELAPFIAAVDPKHADRIYLRTSASPESPTRLLVTDDAGKTYRTLLGAKGPLLGFALTADGTRVHVGGPDDGLYTGSAGALELTETSKQKVQCLARTADALWACSSEGGGFIAGVSRDQGATFEPRLHLRDIAGPLACGEGTAVARECDVDWAKLQRELGLGAPSAGVDASADAGASASAGAG
ncbi:MAG: BNR/Asp-box repeat domain protein, partial [Myxococcaceae bacterium]|nr:BNR/Asp-box repeat domain protein [Myxococcaceae bacterium]